jgi:hypothetical protein
MDILNTATATVALLSALGGTLWVGFGELRAVEQRADEKYVPLSEWQDFQWSQLKRDLRQIEKEIAQAEAEGLDSYEDKLQYEYDSLLEFLCRKYPEDREC